MVGGLDPWPVGRIVHEHWRGAAGLVRLREFIDCSSPAPDALDAVLRMRVFGDLEVTEFATTALETRGAVPGRPGTVDLVHLVEGEARFDGRDRTLFADAGDVVVLEQNLVGWAYPRGASVRIVRLTPRRRPTAGELAPVAVSGPLTDAFTEALQRAVELPLVEDAVVSEVFFSVRSLALAVVEEWTEGAAGSPR